MHHSSNQSSGHLDSFGGRCHIYPGKLPVSRLHIWKKLRLQTTSYHFPHDKLAPYTINAAPPMAMWPHGLHDLAIFNTDLSKKWPQSGLHGMHSFGLYFELWTSYRSYHCRCPFNILNSSLSPIYRWHSFRAPNYRSVSGVCSTLFLSTIL